MQIGSSKAVSLPARWLDWYKRKYGTEPVEVAVEVDEVLIIRPILPNKLTIEGESKRGGAQHG
jgi:hypothetical protein